jgi:hypothetical protein
MSHAPSLPERWGRTNRLRTIPSGGVAQLVEQRTHKPDCDERPLVILNGYKGVFVASLVCVGWREGGIETLASTILGARRD